MNESFFIKTGKDHKRIQFSEIIYLEASDKYVKVFAAQEQFLVLSSFHSLAQQLPGITFCKVHRSYIISLLHLESFSSDKLIVGGNIIPVSRPYRNKFKEHLIILGKLKETVNESKIISLPIKRNVFNY